MSYQKEEVVPLVNLPAKDPSSLSSKKSLVLLFLASMGILGLGMGYGYGLAAHGASASASASLTGMNFCEQVLYCDGENVLLDDWDPRYNP